MLIKLNLMCVIIIKQQKDKKVHKQTLKNSARINPHGLGVVWLDTFEVSYHKSKQYEVLHTDRPFIAHFRYATVGVVNKSNTHPFLCGNNTDELLMQNGTIRGLGSPSMCDSKVLAISLGRVKRQNWKKELSQYDSRFTTINTRTRTFQIYNKELWTKKNGVWYSKPNVLMDNLVAVYGTLKKGYSNYHHYLKKSVYLGGGETKDKYPLLIEGLPYMVNQRGVGHNVEVDVFKVSDQVLANLDQLEGHPSWYRREEIPVKLASGKVLTCWLYFNPKKVSKNTTFHKTYTQSYNPYVGSNNTNWYSGYSKPKHSLIGNTPTYKSSEFDWSQSSFDFDEEEADTFREDELLLDDEELKTKPFCVNCYNDLEFDGFSNYHCNKCDSWFTEQEVLTDSI